jgi:hypothetical protein
MKIAQRLQQAIGLTGLALAFIPSFASASLVEFVGEPSHVIKESGVEVPVYQEARVQLDTHKSQPLYLTGSGIYIKKVAFIKAKVYAAVSYIDTPSGISKDKPLDTIAGSRSKVIQMTLFRHVSADQIQENFRKALKANQVDMEAPVIKGMFAHLNFDVEAGQTITFISRTDTRGLDHLVVEGGPETYTAQADELGLTLWKMWFGNPKDQGTATLKADLIGK